VTVATMTEPVAIGIIGSADQANWIARHAGYLPGLHIAAWSPVGDDGSLSERLATESRCEFRSDWRATATDPAIAAVLVLGAAAAASDAVVAAIECGKVAACHSDALTSSEVLRRIEAEQVSGKGMLLARGEISGTASGALAIKAAAEASLGTLHSIYVAVRKPRRQVATTRDVIAELGWSACEFVLSCTSSPLQRVYASGGALFQPRGTLDTCILLLRFEDGMVATLELSCCLPSTIPCPAAGETEFELIGSREVLRAKPFNAAVGLFSDDRTMSLPWPDEPVTTLLRDIGPALAGKIAATRDLAHQRRLISLMTAVRRSLDQADAVLPALPA
jgi:predicted dehydrogenase